MLRRARTELNPQAGLLHPFFSDLRLPFVFLTATLMEIGIGPLLNIPLVFMFLNYFGFFIPNPKIPFENKIYSRAQTSLLLSCIFWCEQFLIVFDIAIAISYSLLQALLSVRQGAYGEISDIGVLNAIFIVVQLVGTCVLLSLLVCFLLSFLFTPPSSRINALLPMV